MRYHMIFIFLCLTYFTQYDNFDFPCGSWCNYMALLLEYDNLQVHPCCYKCYFILFMTERYSTEYMNHIFLIHSSVNEHLGCFYILAIGNSAAVDIGMYISFQIMIFSRQKPRSGLLDHTVVQFQFFEEALYCYFFFFLFQGCTCGIWKFPGQGSNQSCSCQPTPLPQQCGIQTMSVTYSTAHGNARSQPTERGQVLNLRPHG